MRIRKYRGWVQHTQTLVHFELGQNNIGYVGKDGEFYHIDVEDFDDIMDFTGLRDKNGKEIYEGDIYQWTVNAWNMDVPPTYTNKTYTKVVEYEESECDGYPYIGYDFPTLNIEVIGNIHENPELLNS